jgi:ribonuclease HI
MKNDIFNMEFEQFLQCLGDGGCISVYTDGSCIGNPGPGGWCAIFVCGGNKSFISGAEESTTNNRMEMFAAISALESLPDSVRIVIHTDSVYLKQGITTWIKQWKKNGWKSSTGKPVKNKELWERLDKVSEFKEIEWKWVKAHANCENNNNADYLAKSAIMSLNVRGD